MRLAGGNANLDLQLEKKAKNLTSGGVHIYIYVCEQTPMKCGGFSKEHCDEKPYQRTSHLNTLR